MATALHNLSNYDANKVPSAADMHFGIVVSEWNENITGELLKGATSALIENGAKEENIFIEWVPGSFELTSGAKWRADNIKNLNAVICLGCVIRGDTPHFDYVCQGTTQGIVDLNLRYDQSFIFGLLTTDNLQQAEDRCGGKHGNKGTECAITAIKMVAMHNRLKGMIQ